MITKWINTKEKLPGNNEKILIYDKDEGVCTAIYKDGKFDSDFAGIYPIGDAESNIFTSNVTHWMPLPFPPNMQVTIGDQLLCAARLK